MLIWYKFWTFRSLSLSLSIFCQRSCILWIHKANLFFFQRKRQKVLNDLIVVEWKGLHEISHVNFIEWNTDRMQRASNMKAWIDTITWQSIRNEFNELWNGQQLRWIDFINFKSISILIFFCFFSSSCKSTILIIEFQIDFESSSFVIETNA